MGFLGGTVVKNPLAHAGNAKEAGSIPVLERSPGVYSCLEISMDRGAWWATVHGATKSWTRLSD